MSAVDSLLTAVDSEMSDAPPPPPPPLSLLRVPPSPLPAKLRGLRRPQLVEYYYSCSLLKWNDLLCTAIETYDRAAHPGLSRSQHAVQEELVNKAASAALAKLRKHDSAGRMAETNEGINASPACTICARGGNLGHACYVWRDARKEACAYCRFSGKTGCDVHSMTAPTPPSLEDRIAAAEVRMAAYEDRIAAVDGRIAASDERAAAAEQTATALQSKLEAVERMANKGDSNVQKVFKSLAAFKKETRETLALHKKWLLWTACVADDLKRWTFALVFGQNYPDQLPQETDLSELAASGKEPVPLVRGPLYEGVTDPIKHMEEERLEKQKQQQ